MTSAGHSISVCLLSYNHVDVIESTLESVLNQTIDGYEILVSDDRSTDGTWEMILNISRKVPRIIPIQTNHNLGMAGNANFAVSKSNRPFIALLHHDDLYRSDLLEKWLSVIEKYPDITFVFNAYDVPDAALQYGPKLSTQRIEGLYFFEEHLLKRWGCPVRGTAMVRRSAWNAIRGMREEFGLLADVDMWMRLSRYGPVGYVPEPIIKPRHCRPNYYPDIYTGKQWHWKRHTTLLNIHATNYLEHHTISNLCGTIRWWRFCTKLSVETAKWLSYAVIRQRWSMIKTCRDSTTRHDQVWLCIYRHFLYFIFKPFCTSEPRMRDATDVNKF